MNIRKATVDDAEKIRALVSGLSHFCLSSDETKLPGWLAATFELNEFKLRLQNSEFTQLVCEAHGDIIGYIAIKNKNHIYHLFVSRQHQRKGIAKALWQSVLKLSLSSNYTVRSSLYAVPVYASFGFIKTAPVDIRTIFNTRQWN